MKRIALIADLHGNLPAVEALDNDLKFRNVDDIWCLGDIVGKGPSSAETFDWAFQHCSLILQGNWDEGVGNRYFDPNDTFFYRQLGDERMKKLRELPREFSTCISGKKTRLIHGRFVMPSLLRPTDEEELLTPYFAPDYQILGYADYHRPGLRSMTGFPGLLFVIGSVGCSMGFPMVQYALLEYEDIPSPAPFGLTFLHVPYDNAAALRDAEAHPDLPQQKAYLTEISTGIYAHHQDKRK